MEKRQMMREIRNLYYSNLTCAAENDGSWDNRLQGDYYSADFSYI